MIHLQRRGVPILLLIASSLFLSPMQPAAANGSTNPVELMKYLNPLQKKGYLNQAQDRIIKKKSFKTGDLPAGPVVSNKELGFFAIVPPARFADSQYVEDLLSNQRVNGISVLIPWKLLEPGDDEYNWQTVDSLLSLCEKSQKSLILRVSTCGVDLPAQSDGSGGQADSDTPSWVFAQGAQSVSYSSADGKKHLMPVFWDAKYLASWGNFIKSLGKRYDASPSLHSVGITGGGFAGGTAVVPDCSGTSSTREEKAEAASLMQTLQKDHGMTSRQLVEHWKYVADVFPKRFPTARLNFAINAPTLNRAGEDTLDEISDYLVYRYGERIYLTRQNLRSARHGFDDYRVLLKFRNDTLTGEQLTAELPAKDMERLARFALDDGISFLEMTPELLSSSDPDTQAALDKLASHIGFQVLSQKAELPAEVVSGEPLKVSFSFLNLGAALPLRPERQFDKDMAASFKVQVELRGADGKAVVQNIHTPGTPTNKWTPGTVVSWQEDLKMPPLPPGQYRAFLSLIDPVTKRSVNILDGTVAERLVPSASIALGTIRVVPAGGSPEKVLGSSASQPPVEQ